MANMNKPIQTFVKKVVMATPPGAKQPKVSRSPISVASLERMTKHGEIRVKLEGKGDQGLVFKIPEPGKSEFKRLPGKTITAFGKSYTFGGTEVGIGRSMNGEYIFIRSATGPVYYKEHTIDLGSNHLDRTSGLVMSVTLKKDMV